MNSKEQIPSIPKPSPPFPHSFFQDEAYILKEDEEALEIKELQKKSIWPPLPLD